MNNIKISQLDENLSPSLSAVTIVIQNDIAKKATIQSIKETIFSTGVTVNGTLDVTSDVTIDGDVMITGDTQTIYNWTAPTTSKWSIVECQGHNTISISGSTSPGLVWFPFSGVPMSNGTRNMGTNHLRGGFVTYYANCNGTADYTLQTGTIHFVRDSEAVTNETKVAYDGDSSIYFGEGGSFDGLKVYANNASEYDIIIQWTAKLFYAEEFFC